MVNTTGYMEYQPGNKLNTQENLTANTILTTLVALVILLTLTMSLVRVVTNAQENYEVYVYEKQALGILRQENSKLQNELEYYRSYDYKKLYARDYLKLAESGEKLYQIEGNVINYSVSLPKVDIFTPGVAGEWWWLLI